MIRFRKCIAAVLLVLALGGVGLAQQIQRPSADRESAEDGDQGSRKDANRDTGEEHRTLQLLPALKEIVAALEDQKSEQSKDATKRKEQREEQALQAQIENSRWAFGAMIAAAGAAILNAFALAGLFYTWRETRRAAKAAADAVDVTRDQLRARLSLEGGSLTFFLDDTHEALLHLAILNSGQTPATDIKVSIKLWLSPQFDDNPTELTYESDPEFEKILGTYMIDSIAAGRNVTLSSHFNLFSLFSRFEHVIPHIMGTVAHRYGRVKVKCRIQYRDIYGGDAEKVLELVGSFGAGVDNAVYEPESSRFTLEHYRQRQDRYSLTVPRPAQRPQGFDF